MIVLTSLVVGGIASARPSEEKTLTISWLAEGKIGMDLMVKNFKAVNPDIDVQVHYLPFAQLTTATVTQLQAGNADDILGTVAGNTQPTIGVFPLAAQGKLLDLSGSPWQKRISPAIRPYVKRKDRFYGLPISSTVIGVLYNVDLLKQLNLTVPKTFDQLLAMCPKIAAAGKIPVLHVGVGPQASLTTAATTTSFVFGPDKGWILKRYKKQVTFAGSPLWKAGLQAVIRMKDAKCFSPGAVATTFSQAQAQMARGEAVMFPSGSGYPGVVAINPNVNVDEFPFPGPRPQDGTVGLSVTHVLAVNKATKVPDLAKKFVDFVGRPKQAKLYATVSAQVASTDLKTGIVSVPLKGLARAFKEGRTVIQSSTTFPNGQVNAALANRVNGLLTGQSTVDEILQEMDKAWGP